MVHYSILLLVLFLSLVQWGSCKDEKVCAEAFGDKSLLLCFKDTLHKQARTALSSWNTSAHPSSWKGTQWNNQSDNLLKLNLSDASLSGRLWPVWCRLPLLEVLIFSNNNFSGHLSFDGCRHNASHLRMLNLFNNSLSGTIPQSISIMRALEYLQLGANKLTGSIPQGLWNLVGLRFLSLTSNALNGSLPPELRYLTNLQSLDISGNQLSDSIPPEISSCTTLRKVYLQGNLLSGEIPNNIGKLSNLIIFAVDGNNLEGNLPPSLGNLTALKLLELGYNSITGSFPEAMKHMVSLRYLSVSTNHMGGRIPSWLGNFTNLRHLILYRNNFIGSIPPQLGSLKYLKFPTKIQIDPDFAGVQLENNLSPAGGDAQKVLFYPYDFFPTVLDLCENKLSGSIPPELGELQNLQHLWLCDKMLSGPIPSSFANATCLILFELYDNQLSGQIPPQLTKLTSLSYFNVSNNNLSGPIPTSGQFSTFNDVSTFAGNPGLCGGPLNKSCKYEPQESSPIGEEDENGDLVAGVPFGVGAVVGLTAGFWAVMVLVPESFMVRLTKRIRLLEQ